MYIQNTQIRSAFEAAQQIRFKEAVYRRRVREKSTETLELYSARIHPRGLFQKICYGLCIDWQMRKRIVEDVLRERNIIRRDKC